jgi:hypothetical protein
VIILSPWIMILFECLITGILALNLFVFDLSWLRNWSWFKVRHLSPERDTKFLGWDETEG